MQEIVSDDILLTQILEGNEKSFAIFVEKYKRKILKTCYGITLDNETAKDLTQDVFLALFESIHKFKGDAKISTWLYKIAINKSLDHLRSKKRKQLFNIFEILSDKSSVFEPTTDLKQQPDKILENKELNKILMQNLDSLTDKQRVAFTLHKIDDYSHKEIAETMQLSVSAVESLIFLAKKNLKKKLQSYLINSK